MPPSEVEKIFPAFAESRKAELPRFTPDSILITPENKFDDAIYNYLYAYWKEYSGKYDPKGNVVASNTANHLSLEYKTENELRFAQWAMREYGMTNKERTTHTFKGQMSVLLEVWNVVDMITLPISLVSAGGKFIGKEVAKEVGEELGEKAVKEVAKEAVEKTIKKETAEEVAENTAKKEMADTAADLSWKPGNKNDVLEGSKAIEVERGILGETRKYRVSNEIIEQGKRIIHFDCPDDPIRDILGRGIDSNPEEWNHIIKELQDSGVEIIYREGVMGYAPHPSVNGKPGQFLIDPNASISALDHEYLHFKQAQNAGFPNMQGAFEDSASRIANETASYAVEIQRAEELGLDNVVEQLQKNLQEEINKINTTLDWPE